MANSRRTYEPAFASNQEFKRLLAHVGALTGVVNNLVDRMGLTEHALSQLIEDAYYVSHDDESSAPDSAPEDVFDDNDEPEFAETDEEYAARVAEEMRQEAIRTFENEGNPHVD